MASRKRPPRQVSPERAIRTATIKANLRAWHDARPDLTDVAIARACGVDPVTVRRWKNDDNDATPQVSEAAPLCAVFGRSIGELLRPLGLPELDDQAAKLARSILGVP